MTQTGEVTKPGTGLIKVGLVLAVVGILFTIAVVSAGGNLVPLWLVLAGLVLAGIGFAQRVLHALERR
jgi:integral membrane sensor domain MASE1